LTKDYQEKEFGRPRTKDRKKSVGTHENLTWKSEKSEGEKSQKENRRRRQRPRKKKHSVTEKLKGRTEIH